MKKRKRIYEIQKREFLFLTCKNSTVSFHISYSCDRIRLSVCVCVCVCVCFSESFTGPNVQPTDDRPVSLKHYENWLEQTEALGEETDAVSLGPAQIPHGLPCN
jgi:hypothetical protein